MLTLDKCVSSERVNTHTVSIGNAPVVLADYKPPALITTVTLCLSHAYYRGFLIVHVITQNIITNQLETEAKIKWSKITANLKDI